MNKLTAIFILFITLGFLSCKKEVDRTSILGSWNCEEISTLDGSVDNYQVIIESYVNNSDSNQYKIINFHRLDLGAENFVIFQQEPDGSLIIPDQILGGKGWFIYGIGEVKDDFSRISLTYSIDFGTGAVDKVEYKATYY